MAIDNENEYFSDEKHIKLYPNPTNGQEITLELLEELENASVQIYNAMGQSVGAYEFNESNLLRMQTEGLRPGVYFVEVKSEFKMIDRVKFIVN